MVSEKYIRDYLVSYEHQLFNGKWNYTGGCVLMGAIAMYEATGDASYLDVVQNFAKEFVDAQGTIYGYAPQEHNVDLMCSGNVLYFLSDSCGDSRFRTGIETVMRNLREQPRTQEGNFWHKGIYPNQVWLDGLYMAQPFYVRYITRYAAKKDYADTISQFRNVRKYLFDEEKKLYYHGYDESRQVYWADKETGRSRAFWLRAIGWYVMALVDCYESMDCPPEDKQLLADLLRECIEGLLLYQDKRTCLFYQVVDMPHLPGNYLESSGSAMIAYALLKGARLSMLRRAPYAAAGEAVLCGLVTENMAMDHGRIRLKNSCRTAGLGPADDLRRDGTPAYYVSEPITDDNAHGAAAFIMAYSEYLKLKKEKEMQYEQT